MKHKNLQTKEHSRKYQLTLLIFFASVIMCLFPPVLSMFFAKTQLVILSGSEWVSTIAMLSGFYFGANVWQKKILGDISEMSINNDISPQSKQTTLPMVSSVDNIVPTQIVPQAPVSTQENPTDTASPAKPST